MLQGKSLDEKLELMRKHEYKFKDEYVLVREYLSLAEVYKEIRDAYFQQKPTKKGRPKKPASDKSDVLVKDDADT